VQHTEYHPLWQQRDWFAVAHDDPDAGTFLLFTKGQFLTTGDGYERVAKVTTQHSTFIVDDATQNGGGGGWCQPPDTPAKTAWPLDCFVTGERAVFRGDLHGTYANMARLTRTFVSQQAKYFVIYDDALSATANRTFQWQLQTAGTLADQGDRTYKVTSGAAATLVKLYDPSTAVWSDTTNKIGNILRARLTGQTESRFMVLVWPNAANLDAVREHYVSDSTLGLRVAQGRNYEYTLFAKGSQGIAAGPIKAKAAAVVVAKDSSMVYPYKVGVSNGTSFTYSGCNISFNSTTPVNFTIDYYSTPILDEPTVLHVAPAAGTDTSMIAQLSIGTDGGQGHVVVISNDGVKDSSGIYQGNNAYITLKCNKEYQIYLIPNVDIDDKLVRGSSAVDVSFYPLPVAYNLTCSMLLRFNGRVIVTVRDCRGNSVKDIFNGLLPAGPHQFTWDCADQLGRRVEPGVYFVVINGQAYRVVVAGDR
jgi:hypothetical protein